MLDLDAHLLGKIARCQYAADGEHLEKLGVAAADIDAPAASSVTITSKPSGDKYPVCTENFIPANTVW